MTDSESILDGYRKFPGKVIMKYIYKTKLLKETQNKDPIMESMLTDGWTLHKAYKEGLVFKKPVPENYIRAWFVADWQVKDGDQVEILVGPYASEDEAKDLISKTTNNKTLRIERTWVAPIMAEPTGSRMDRLADIFCTSPADAPVKEKEPEVIPVPPPATTRVSDDQGDWSIRTATEPINNRMNTIGVRSNTTPVSNSVSADDIPRIRNYIARATSRRMAAPTGSPRSHRANPGRPQIRTNILDSMRNFGQTAAAIEAPKDTDEPSEEDLRIMERNRQAAERHDP